MKAFAKIWVGGVVQGVGFRFFVVRTAQNYGLDGMVKNLVDSRVYIEVEGEKGLIQDFAKEMKIGPSLSRVSNLEIKWPEYGNKYSGFSIDY